MAFTKSQKTFVKYAEQHGFELCRSHKHIIMRRDGRSLTISKSASDGRAYMNFKKDVDRIVAELEGRK